jgi:hypothetical protein
MRRSIGLSGRMASAAATLGLGRWRNRSDKSNLSADGRD